MADNAREADAIAFREIEPEDLEALSSFLQENDVPSVVRTFNPFPMTTETARKIALEDHRDRYYGAFTGECLVGMSMLRGWDEGHPLPSFGIMVDHRRHNMGIGGRMLDYTIEQARKLGSPRIRLTVYESNKAGVHLYTSRGFVEDSRHSMAIMGESDAKIVMFKELA